jgi:pectinesterase
MRFFSSSFRAFCSFAFFAAALAAPQTTSPPSAAFPEVPPFHLPSGVAVEHDVIYARYGTRELHVDFYHPAEGQGLFPGVVFMHGGGWSGGTPMQFRREAAYLASRGFAAATIEYRLSTEAKYPAAIYDGKAAVRWMRENAKKYSIDSEKIAAVGGSAGGHLAAMLGTTNGIQRFEGGGGHANYSSSVQAVVAFNGVYDLVTSLEKPGKSSPELLLSRFLGGRLEEVPEQYVDASPVAHVCKDSAPFLLLHGTGDTVVRYQQALEMREALEGVGVRAELYTAKDANHGFFNSPPYYQPTLERMAQFLRSVFGK